MPHIKVAVHATKSPQPTVSKWGGGKSQKPNLEGKLGAKLTTGYMMIDTGAGLTLLTKKWCQVHNVVYDQPTQVPDAHGANGSVITIIGTVPSLTIRLSPSLELELENMAV